MKGCKTTTSLKKKLKQQYKICGIAWPDLPKGLRGLRPGSRKDKGAQCPLNNRRFILTSYAP